MQKITSVADTQAHIRIAALLWIGYLMALALIDQFVVHHFPIAPIYYIVNGLHALLLLGIAHVSWLPQRLKGSFPALIIFLIATLTIISHHLMVPALPLGPAYNVEAMSLRQFPILLIALIITAWHYRWRYVVLFSLGTATLNLTILWVLIGPSHPPFHAGVFVTTIQTASFLAVGYFVSRLMQRLRIQQRILEDTNAQLTHYASTLEHLAISRERNRIARELHDTLAHTLSGLTVQLETVKAYWDRDPTRARTLLDKSQTATRCGLEETRRALKALRASPLDDLGLVLALREMATEAAARANLHLDLLLPEQIIPFSAHVEQCVYRIAQEAVANVVYHANAQKLAVHLTYNEERIALVVCDNGIGFDTTESNRPGHFGLPSMHERAHLAGGTLTIQSQPGHGTTVQLIVARL